MTIKSASAPGHPGGYSFVELITTISVATVLAAVAAPSLGSMVMDHRRSTVANELLGTLILARSEAIKRGVPVIVCGFRDANRDGRVDGAERACAGKDWSDGWLLAVWGDADGDDTVDAGELEAGTVRYYFNGAAGVTVTAGNFTATPPVAPAGTAVQEPFLTRSANGTITVCDRRGAGSARAVIVSPSGRARVSTRRASGEPLSCPKP